MPNKPPPRPANTRRLSALRGLWPFLLPHRARIALAFVLLCLGSAAILLVPLAFRDLIDFGFGERERSAGGLLAGLAIGFAARRGRHGAAFWTAASAIALCTGSMGCACIGSSGVLGLAMGYAAGATPALAALTLARRSQQ